MMKPPKYWLLLVWMIPFCLLGQKTTNPVEGVVSFVTSRHVYVKFEGTENIAIGDTLKLEETETPCLEVSSKSSTSCVCIRINACIVQKGDKIRFEGAVNPTPVPDVSHPEPDKESLPSAVETDNQPAEILSLFQEKIRGRISLSSYSNIASMRDDRNRIMARLMFAAQHINNSRFSFESHINYRQVFPANPKEFNPQTRLLRIYNLALRYEVDPSLSIVLGRRINPKVASLGAIDGLQVEKKFGLLYAGAIVGTRPDIQTYSINANLLEYGGYIGAQTDHKEFYSQTTAGLIEQRNAGKIDRRYAYFQHNSTIARRFSLFSSMELDLYSAVNGIVSNASRLSSLYVSGTYRAGRKVSLMVSFDSRKRILYYETFQTEIERLLDDDLARQGLRARINIRPHKDVTIGLSYSNRFQTDQQNKSDNFHGSVTWSRLPAIGGRLTLTGNRNTSNYLTSNIISVRHSRTLVENRLRGDLYYRLAGYVFVNSDKVRQQQYAGMNLALKVSDTVRMSLAGEVSTFNQEQNYRVYFRVSKRLFRKKRH